MNPNTTPQTPDDFKNHDVVPYYPDSGPCRWICTKCKEKSSDINWFKKYECSEQPDVIGGGG